MRALLLALGLGLFTTAVMFAAVGDIDTVAGTGTVAGYSGDLGPATSAQLNLPFGVAVDSSGNVFIADTSNNVIRKVDTSGIITTVAGNGLLGFTGDGVAATTTRLNAPHGVEVDSSGNLFIADTFNHRIRKVGTSGIITTVGGDGTEGFSGDTGLATSAQLARPRAVAVDSAGNLFIADRVNQRIRKVDTSGIITTVAGDGNGGFAGDGGPATSAQFAEPWGVAVDSAGNLFIADEQNNRIRKVDISGNISTFAGNGGSGFSGDGGAATDAEMAGPAGIAVDSAGNLFIATPGLDKGPFPNRVRKVDTSGIISTVAGNGSQGFSGDGSAATSAQMSSPEEVAVSPAGDLFIADRNNSAIRRVVGVAAAVTADLAIAKSPHLVLRPVSSSLTYTLTVTNNGPDAASDVTVTDTLPGAVTFVSASAGCGESGGTVTCAAASLANGSSVQFTITVTTPGTPGTVFSNTASVTLSGAIDPDTSDNSATAQITATNPPSVPGLTTWGLGALAMGLGALVLVARRRRAAFLR